MGFFPPIVAIFTALSLLQLLIRTEPPIVNLGYIASDGMESHITRRSHLNNVKDLKNMFPTLQDLTLPCDEMMMQPDRKCSRQEPS